MRQRALAAKAAGDDGGAAQLFAAGLAAHPTDAAFANSAGNFHAGAGRPETALTLFDRALLLAPGLHEAAINRAVVLTRLGRATEAAAYLRERAADLSAAPRYWTVRAAAELTSGETGAAAASYDEALRRDPTNVRARIGRARAALERGEDRAVDDHERALSASPGDPNVLLGYAQALDAAGRSAEALIVSEALATQLTGWTEGLELHARLRWARGDGDAFADHYVAAVKAAREPGVYRSWAAMLAGVDRQSAAADVLSAARRFWSADSDLALAEAIAAGEAGDDARAWALFDGHRRDEPAWQVAEARQRLREADPLAADELLEAAVRAAPGDVTGWGLRDLCWRLLGDERHTWLHGQPGVIQTVPLDLSDEQVTSLRALLDRLHDRSGMPVGQSVKHGSQTRGALFARPEPEIALIANAVTRALETYRAGLPPSDPSHPLLRYRDKPWLINGSWSIRLDGAGHHAPHIHPHGILSSAAYLAVPSQVLDQGGQGRLELGRPPAELRVDLPPIATIAPQVGLCALFPSTLFHGTRPISAGRRTTVAFDVTAAG